MTIKTGKRSFVSSYKLRPGDLIEFGYDGKVRLCVFISPDWNNMADCYQFETVEDAEEILEWTLNEFNAARSGDLYVDFGNAFPFKSFKHDKMTTIQQIEYKLEEQGNEQTEKQEEKIGEVKEILQDMYIDNGNLYGE